MKERLVVIRIQGREGRGRTRKRGCVRGCTGAMGERSVSRGRDCDGESGRAYTEGGQEDVTTEITLYQPVCLDQEHAAETRLTSRDHSRTQR